jgi:DNA polymerase-3 subunit delta
MPTIGLPALQQQLASRQLGPLYLFAGEDTHLIDRLVHDVEATVDEADRPFAVERLHAGETGGSPVDIAAAARVLPMLGDRRIVIVLRAERLLKPKRASRTLEASDDGEEVEAEAAIDAAPLEDFIANPTTFSTVVFVATDVDRTRRLTKRLLERAQVAFFGGIAADHPAERAQARSAGINLVNDELRREGRAIDPAAAALLVDRAGGDISKLRGDLERLRLFTDGRPRVTKDDVLEVVAESVGVVDDWAVVNAIADGDAARALADLDRRLDRGDSVHQIVGQLRWWVSQRLAPADPSRVKPALDALLRTDLALKSSGGEERALVERLVVDLTGRPVRSPGGWR